MIAVIFEVIPTEAGAPVYFDIAAQLKQSVSQIDGFISIERFQSLSNPKKYLSLSFWQSEDAIQQWRQNLQHQQAQMKGKNELFEYYKINVGEISRTYGS